MDKNREFAELAGILWNDEEFNVPTSYYDNEKKEWMYGVIEIRNPDFTDPRLVLKEMKRLGKLSSFMMWLWDSESCEDDLGNVLMSGVSFLQLLDYILDTTGLLRDKAIEWMKGNRDIIPSAIQVF